MDPNARTTLVAVFPNRGQAEAAVNELGLNGIDHERVGILAPGGPVDAADTNVERRDDTAAGGAAGGALTGGAVGALAGAAVAALIPGIGPVLATGILAGVATGAAAGAAVGGFLGPFIAMGVTEEEARYYEGEFRAGRTVVVVQPGPQMTRAETILRGNGGVFRSPTSVAGPSS